VSIIVALSRTAAFRNVGNHYPSDTTSRPWRPECSGESYFTLRPKKGTKLRDVLGDC